MPEGGPALVHHLGLALGVEVLRDLAHDADDFALPWLQQRGVLLDEIQQVFLGFARVAGVYLLILRVVRVDRDGAPQLVDLALQVLFALLLALPFFRGRDRVGPLVAVDAVVHQRMAGVEQVLDGVNPVAVFAFADVLLGEHQVVNDRAGVGPAAEQVVALEERVVAVAGVGNHQCLHAHGVLFHQVGNAGVGVDDDLVGQPHVATAVALFGGEKMLAVGPVVIAQRHAYRGVGVHHLLCSDDLDLVGIGIQSVDLMGDTADLLVVLADQLEGPLRAGGYGVPAHVAILFWNSLRNTG